MQPRDANLRSSSRMAALAYRALYLSPDGTRILTATRDKIARIWDAASGRKLAILEGHDSWLSSAAFSPNGSRVVTTSNDGSTRLWDAASN